MLNGAQTEPGADLVAEASKRSTILAVLKRSNADFPAEEFRREPNPDSTQAPAADREPTLRASKR